MSRVVVHIGRLVVPGASERREIEAAVTAAIRRELGRPGAVEAMVAAGDRTRIAATGGDGHSANGAAIARSLTGGKP